MDPHTALTAELFLREQAAHSQRRVRLQVRLARVLRALQQWDEWYANEQLPADLRREVRAPLLEVDSLEGLRAMLLEELALLDGEG